MYYTSVEEAARKFAIVFKRMQWRWRNSDKMPTEEELIQQFRVLEESIREKRLAQGTQYVSSTIGRLRVSKLQEDVHGSQVQFLYHLNPRDMVSYETFTDDRVTYIEFLEEFSI